MKLNLGCGDDYKEGWINVDISDNVKSDVKHDLNVIPFPFRDRQFSYIEASHVLEHIDRKNFVLVMKELHRILKPGGILHVICPMNDIWNDPTHLNMISVKTFRYFEDDKYVRIYGLPKFIIKSKMVRTKYFKLPVWLAKLYPLHKDFEVVLQKVDSNEI